MGRKSPRKTEGRLNEEKNYQDEARNWRRKVIRDSVGEVGETKMGNRGRIGLKNSFEKPQHLVAKDKIHIVGSEIWK